MKRRPTWTVTGYGPPPLGGSCGHAHPTREDALQCVRRGRSNIERTWTDGEGPAPTAGGWCLVTAAAFVVCALGWYAFFCQ